MESTNGRPRPIRPPPVFSRSPPLAFLAPSMGWGPRGTDGANLDAGERRRGTDTTETSGIQGV
eukprot:9259555-Pyramimonas_sp.AAC.3